MNKIKEFFKKHKKLFDIMDILLTIIIFVISFVLGAIYGVNNHDKIVNDTKNPLMAQRKNAISPDSINNILNFNVNEMPSLFYFNDEEGYSPAYANVNYENNINGNLDEVYYATGLDFDLPCFTMLTVEVEIIEQTRDSHTLEFIISIEDYIEYISSPSTNQDYIFENNLSNDTLFYFYLGQCNVSNTNFEGSLTIDLSNIRINYRDGSINYNLYDFGAEEVHPFFNRILDIKEFVFVYDVAVDTQVYNEFNFYLTQYFCPVRVEEWFDSLELTNSGSYDFGYNVGYNEGFSNGVQNAVDPLVGFDNTKLDELYYTDTDIYVNDSDLSINFNNQEFDLNYNVQTIKEDRLDNGNGSDSGNAYIHLYNFNSYLDSDIKFLSTGFDKIVLNYNDNSSAYYNINDYRNQSEVSFENNKIVSSIDLYFNALEDVRNGYYLYLFTIDKYMSGYQTGYSQGLTQGQDNVLLSPNNFNLYSRDEYLSFGDLMKQQGINIGRAEGCNVNNLFFSIADIPMRILGSLLSFDLFGVNMFVAFGSIATLLLIIWVVKKII